MLTRKEAQEALMAGKKIRHVEWNNDDWAELNEDMVLVDEDGEELSSTVYCPWVGAWLDKYWEIYNPEPEMVAYEPYTAHGYWYTRIPGGHKSALSRAVDLTDFVCYEFATGHKSVCYSTTRGVSGSIERPVKVWFRKDK